MAMLKPEFTQDFLGRQAQVLLVTTSDPLIPFILDKKRPVIDYVKPATRQMRSYFLSGVQLHFGKPVLNR